MIKTSQNEVSAPAPGQDNTLSTRAPPALDNSSAAATVINVSLSVPTVLDVRIRDRYVRYVSDPRPGPDAGIWRTVVTRARISPFAIVGIGAGRHGIAILAVHPKTGIRLEFEGDLDTIASDLHRAAARIGSPGDRQGIFWALREFSGLVRRQQAARGVAQ